MKRNGYNEYNDTTTLITVEIHQIKNLNDKRQ